MRRPAGAGWRDTGPGRPEEAETIFAGALQQPASDQVKGALHHNYGLALARQRRGEQALEHLARAKALNPALPHSDAVRAEILQEMKRYDEALAISRQMIAQRSGQSGMAQIPQRHSLSPGPARRVSQIL